MQTPTEAFDAFVSALAAESKGQAYSVEAFDVYASALGEEANEMNFFR